MRLIPYIQPLFIIPWASAMPFGDNKVTFGVHKSLEKIESHPYNDTILSASKEYTRHAEINRDRQTTEYVSFVKNITEQLGKGGIDQKFKFTGSNGSLPYGLEGLLQSSVADKGWVEQVRNASRNAELPPSFSLSDKHSDITIQGLGTAQDKINQGTIPYLPDIPHPPLLLTGWVYAPFILPVTPLIDPFYHPTGFQHLKLGQVISWRPISGDIIDPLIQQAYQLSFRSETGRGDAEAQVTTVLVPWVSDNTNVISFIPFEDANNLQCSPSYAFVAGFTFSTFHKILSMGFVVNMPDVEGPQSLFGIASSNGIAALNSMRAYENFRKGLILKVNNHIHSAWGYSGGTFAALYIAEFHHDYAPDIRMGAVAAGGVIANMKASALSLTNTEFAGFIVPIFNSFLQYYPEQRHIFDEHFKPEYKQNFESFKTYCIVEEVIVGSGMDFFSWFKNGVQYLDIPEIAQREVENDPGRSVNAIPLLLYGGTEDIVAPIGTVEDLVTRYCEMGGHLEFIKGPGKSHLDFIVGLDDQVGDFFERVLKHGYNPPQCQTWHDIVRYA